MEPLKRKKTGKALTLSSASLGPLEEASQPAKKHIKKRPYIIPLLGLVLGVMIAAGIWFTRGSGQAFRPSDAHIVFLFDRGQKRILDTKATTVGQLISRLKLGLIKQDVIEPALNTPILEDNFRINIYHARPVTIVDGQTRAVILTAQRSPREVAQAGGLKVNPEDLAKFVQGDLKQNVIGEQVVVSRAIPIKLNLYGTQVASYTQAKTVGEMLAEKHIKLDNGESVKPSAQTAVTANMQIFVLAKDTKVETTEEPLPFPTQKVNDPTLSFGTTAVRQEGANGKQLVTYLVISKKGQAAQKKKIQAAVIEAPVPKIVAVGSTIAINGDKTGVMAAAGISSGDFQYVNYIVSRESNWHPTAGNSSGAYGLCQALPGSKMATAGGDWPTNPVTQLRWCNGYAAGHYGGWGSAYNFWTSHGYW